MARETFRQIPNNFCSREVSHIASSTSHVMCEAQSHEMASREDCVRSAGAKGRSKLREDSLFPPEFGGRCAAGGRAIILKLYVP